MVWVQRKRFMGWACSEYAWEFRPSGFPAGREKTDLLYCFPVYLRSKFTSFMPKETPRETRRYERIFLPKGMSVTWYGGGQQQVSRVKTLSMGGVFLGGSTLRVGTDLTLVFEVPGGMVMAEAVVRNIVPGEGMGVEFTKMNTQSRDLPEGLLTRLLR